MERQLPALTRAEIADAIRRRVGVSNVGAAAMVDAIIDHMQKALERGEEVKIPHFGTFHLLDKEARIGRNPKTGDVHEVTARRVISFRSSGTLRQQVSAPKVGKPL